MAQPEKLKMALALLSLAMAVLLCTMAYIGVEDPVLLNITLPKFSPVVRLGVLLAYGFALVTLPVLRRVWYLAGDPRHRALDPAFIILAIGGVCFVQVLILYG